jgi:hypothetical protein
MAYLEEPGARIQEIKTKPISIPPTGYWLMATA